MQLGKLREEVLLELQIDSNLGLLSDLQSTVIGSISLDANMRERILSSKASLQSDKTKHEQVLFKVYADKRTEKYQSDMLDTCRSKNSELEKQFEECDRQSSEILEKTSCLKKLVVEMGDQWDKMNEGSGIATFSMSISSDPETPARRATILNPCPVCKLWYSCYNQVYTACGHTHHPWCLAEYAKTATTCSVLSAMLLLRGIGMQRWVSGPYQVMGTMEMVSCQEKDLRSVAMGVKRRLIQGVH